MDKKSTIIVKQFPVLGMACASCSANVGKTLEQMPGVKSANVNLAGQSVQVEYDATQVNPAEFKVSLQSAGYDMVIDETEGAKEALEAQKSNNFLELKKRTWWAVGLSLPLAVVAMAFMDMPYANYIMWALGTPVVAWFGRSFFINAWKQLRHRSATMDTLVALSTGIAYLFSVFNMVYPQFWTDRGLHAHVYFEASAVVIAFVLLGRLLEERAKANTSSAIKQLMGLQPAVVTLVNAENQTIEVPIAQVKVGDILLVKPGDKLPVDGTVTEGSSYVDESMISGEPVPVEKSLNSVVFAGTINQRGSFRIMAAKVGGETVLASIIKQVEQAQASKAPVQKLVDKIAAVFVPVVILIALTSLLGWWIFGGVDGLTHGLMAMVTVLVVSCPCALGLATPTAIMVGVGKGAENGILIKDAETLEMAYKLDAIVLDKTGTITVGRPMVRTMRWLNDAETVQHRNILFSIEKSSEHPLADAVVSYLEQDAAGVSLLSMDKIESRVGQGMVADYDGLVWWVGNAKMIKSFGLSVPEIDVDNADTLVFFGSNQQVLAALRIADPVRPSSLHAIRRLQDMGIRVYMLTGDSEQTAAAIARQVGIKDFVAEMMPSEKADFVRNLQMQAKVVGVAGDGINDSEALALADISIAMGKGSDIAMDVAKMTLIGNDLSKIPEAIGLSRRTVRTIQQNLFWAFVYNVLAIPVAAGLLYPINGFVLDPMIAGALMAMSSVSVVSNSLRLKLKSYS